MLKTDLAYAAATIDSEGYVAILHHRRSDYHLGYHYHLVVSVVMTDPLVPTWLWMTFGGNLNDYTRKGLTSKGKPYKHTWHWSITTQNAAQFLLQVLPYLKLKKEQAKLAIEFQKMKTAQRGKYHKHNHKPRVLLEAEAILSEKISELNQHGTQKVDVREDGCLRSSSLLCEE